MTQMQKSNTTRNQSGTAEMRMNSTSVHGRTGSNSISSTAPFDIRGETRSQGRPSDQRPSMDEEDVEYDWPLNNKDSKSSEAGI
jgi:hypothetical protein